jgi:hypothetical protein
MNFPLFRRVKKPLPSEISACCPQCKTEVAITREQALMLAADDPICIFCPFCVELVWGERFVRQSENDPSMQVWQFSRAVAAKGQKLIGGLMHLQW